MKNPRWKEVPAPEIPAAPDYPPQSAEELLNRIPLNVLSRKERAEALKAAENLSGRRMTLEEQIDEYVRGGREALTKIKFLSAGDRHRIETGLLLEKEKGNVKDYPPEVRGTISRLLAETAALFATIGIPDCAEKLLRRRKLSAQGRKPGKPADWSIWADKPLRKYLKKDPLISAALADKQLATEPDVPENMPLDSRKTVGKLLKKMRSKLRPV